MDQDTSEAIVGLLTDPAFWAAVGGVLSVMVGYTKKIGGDRFVLIKRIVGAISRSRMAPVVLALLWLGTGCAGFVGTTDMRAIDPATGAVTAEADCKGVGWSFGQSDVGDGCVGGEAISTPGADLVGKALGAVGAVLKGMGAGLGG